MLVRQYIFMYGRFVYYYNGLGSVTMPAKLHISRKDRRHRRVLSQQIYRLRRRYRYLKNLGLDANSSRVRSQITKLTREYDKLGGVPIHRGNVL